METLETKRLVLKQYGAKDRRNFIKLMTDKVVMEKVGNGVLTEIQAVELWTKLIEDFYPNGIKTIWAVFAGADGRYIGHASLRPRPEKQADWEIGYIIRRKEWGKGLASEIAHKLVQVGLQEMKLSAVFATIDDDNFASIKVAENAGMRFSHYEFDEQGRFSVFSIPNAEKTE